MLRKPPLACGSGMQEHGADMTGANSKLSRRSWLRVYRGTGLLTAISVVLSIIITNVIMETFSAGINVAGLSVSILMPLILGGPAIAFILFKQEQLRAANEQLQKIASTDWLTGCLNRYAFTSRVSADLSVPNAFGALLVVDVDHFKRINDHHGHDLGDEALRLIAEKLARSIDGNDLLGRIGGEEFGIYLPRADAARASHMAETLRDAIASISFIAGGEHCPLSISVGGAGFAGPTAFRDLYRQADAYLYQAKAAGRDRIAVAAAA